MNVRSTLFAIAGFIALLSAARAAERTVAIGIRTYPGDPHISVPQYSDRDEGALQAWLQRVAAQNFVPLQNEAASFDRMLLELRKALIGARDGDTVYLFISARGVARQRWSNGFIGSAGLREEKPESTAIPVSDLADMIEKSHASNVFFLADLCRDPSFDNRINDRLKDRLKAIPKVRGILASAGSQASLEGKLPAAGLIPAGGYGYFAYSLVNGLLARRSTFSGMFEYLEKDLAQRSSGAQRPVVLGARDGVELWPAARRSSLPLLLASRSPLRLGLLFWQAPPRPPPASDAPAAEPDIAEYERLLGGGQFDEVIARLRVRRAELNRADWAALRDRVAVAAADIGQKVVARYGMSGLLPKDPEKLEEPDFVRAARAFETALAILAIGGLDVDEERVLGPYRTSLEARWLFAKGRAAAFHPAEMRAARDLLEQAAAKMSPPIPEISNALGITYLDNPSSDPKQRARDLKTAIGYFQESIKLAPAWPYPRHNLALAYIQLGDSAAAEQVYREAVASAPQLPYPYYNLGLVQQRANKLKDAAESYRKAAAAAALTESDLTKRATEWRDEGAAARADVALARAGVFHANRAEVLNALGTLMEAQKHPDLAADRYAEALSFNPEHCPARHNLAMLELRQGTRLKSAATSISPKDLLEQNTRLCPGFTASWIRLGDILAEARNWPDARSAYEKVLGSKETAADALFAVGKTYEQDAKPQIAADYYRRAVSAYEGQPGGARPLAPPDVYLALARVDGGTACPEYRNAAEAERSGRPLSKDLHKELRQHLATCRGDRR